jgi:hypothetical protein
VQLSRDIRLIDSGRKDAILLAMRHKSHRPAMWRTYDSFMGTEAATLQNPRLRAMTIPREHGAWGLLLVPLATGGVAAAASGGHFGALVLFLIAALALFWLRTPVEAWLGTSAIKAQSQPERVTVARISLVLAAVAVATVVALFVAGYARGLLTIGVLAAVAALRPKLWSKDWGAGAACLHKSSVL